MSRERKNFLRREKYQKDHEYRDQYNADRRKQYAELKENDPEGYRKLMDEKNAYARKWLEKQPEHKKEADRKHRRWRYHNDEHYRQIRLNYNRERYARIKNCPKKWKEYQVKQREYRRKYKARKAPPRNDNDNI